MYRIRGGGGADFALRGHLTMKTFWWPLLGEGCYWHLTGRARDTAECLRVHGTVPTAENCLASKVSRDEAEKPGLNSEPPRAQERDPKRQGQEAPGVPRGEGPGQPC